MWRNLLFALLGGVAANALYFWLSFTALHGLAVKALGPAMHIVTRYLDPEYAAGPHLFLEELGVNIVLYAFWVFIALTGIDVLRLVKRKLMACDN
jgi:hypothetical protein